MIIEYLQPDPEFLEGLAVLVRAVTYAVTLGSAGLVLFGAAFAARLDPLEDAALRRWVLAGAIAGLALVLAALALRVLLLTDGEGLLDRAVWAATLRSRLGDATALRGLGLVLLLAFLVRGRAAVGLSVTGALLVAASYAAMGHSTLYRPRELLGPLAAVHALVVAYWLGSLAPLALVARRADHAGAAALIERWSRSALAMVSAVVATGLALAWIFAPGIDLVLESWWGMGLLPKLALVALVLALAARHRLRLTPALARGAPGAGTRLARSIRIEIVLMLLVCWAAAEMTASHPIDVGHHL